MTKKFDKNWKPESPWADSDGHYWCEKCKEKNKIKAEFEHSSNCGNEDVFRHCEDCGKLLNNSLTIWENLDEEIKEMINIKIETQEDFWIVDYLKEIKEETNNQQMRC